MAYFASKTCCRLLEYSAIDPKVCQEAGVVRGKSEPKENLSEDVIFI